MKSFFILLTMLVVLRLPGTAQNLTPPSTCVPGEVLLDTGGQGQFTCDSVNHWTYVPVSTLVYTQIGVPNGVAPLDSTGKIPAANMGSVTASSIFTTAPITGAVQRTQNARNNDFVSFLDFAGADPTGVTASDAAFVSAVNSGRSIYFPAGTYAWSTQLTITTPVVWKGEGIGKTFLAYTGTAAGSAFTWNYGQSHQLGVGLRDMTLVGPGHSHPVNGLYLGGSSGAEGFSTSNFAAYQFQANIAFGNNAYNIDFFESSFSDGVYNVYYPTGLTNSGENISFRDTLLFTTSATNNIGNCVLIAAGYFKFSNGVADGCQIVNNGGSIQEREGFHHESPNVADSAPFVVNTAGTYDIDHSTFYIGAQSGSPAILAASGGTITVNNADIGNTSGTNLPLVSLSGTGNATIGPQSQISGISAYFTNSGTGSATFSPGAPIVSASSLQSQYAFTATNASGAGGYTPVAALLSPYLPTGAQGYSVVGGTAITNNNSVNCNFYYAGSGSASNSYGCYFWGATTPFWISTPSVFSLPLGVQVPTIKSTTGTRFVCVDTAGNLTSSTTACSGT